MSFMLYSSNVDMRKAINEYSDRLVSQVNNIVSQNYGDHTNNLTLAALWIYLYEVDKGPMLVRLALANEGKKFRTRNEVNTFYGSTHAMNEALMPWIGCYLTASVIESLLTKLSDKGHTLAKGSDKEYPYTQAFMQWCIDKFGESHSINIRVTLPMMRYYNWE